MQHAIEIKWGGISKILSGNPSIETLVETNPLPEGYHWVVMMRDTSTNGEFRWNRKIRLRASGKGQISVDGQQGFSCEMVRAKTSSGFEFDLVVATGSRKAVKSRTTSKTPREGVLPVKGSLSIPFPIYRPSLEQDLTAYGRVKSPIEWVRFLGWGETIKAAKFSGAFTAARHFATMIATKNPTNRLERFDELVALGVKGLFTEGKKPADDYLLE